ncbi:lysozyme inhibitor LprI family protein [Marinomonas ostreistagni]|uniref:lysozyme inhibitor LprI family protein n=1 Tax=Marinomonas ostreistagni TaxID=359209 RepID=UPI00194E2178|nr:lysozyme inhibitor LprI family protein [Marinomonas ostreistagni]MBM6550881.1 DUF1311 domain-containing protein [Marinomonas ostreistagni]
MIHTLRTRHGLYLLAGLLSVSCAANSSDTEVTIDCETAYTTRDMNQCAAQTLAESEQVMQRYLDASLERHQQDPELVQAIELAQQRWQQYRSAHCDAVYTQWREGTIRGVMTLSCKTELTEQRTHALWSNFLTYMDSTAPVLPEPKVSKP